ncbi:reverse transcriptase domain-containing protein [Tanacetum coccineum]
MEEALAAYEEARAANTLEAESQSQNSSDGDNGNGGNGNPNENGREGVVGLTRWFEKMEIVFHISNCPEKYQVKELMKLMIERFQELTMLYTKMVPEELDRVERYIGGLPDNIQGHNVARAYTAGNNERKQYNGVLPLYNKCKFHHEGPCTVRCGKCNKCGRQGNFRSDCLKLKDQNRGNKAGNKNAVGEARGKAYVLGGGDANSDSNVVKVTFLLNNHYAFVLFDSSSDQSFMSTTFSTLLDITPDTLDISYDVELANGRVFETNIVLRGYTLGLLGHPFNIDLMPVKLGSFDVIIGMDWFANHHAVIVCDEKIV